MAHAMAARTVLYEIPGMTGIQARAHEFTGEDGAPLTMSVYLPEHGDDERPPAVVIVEGYPDPGFSKAIGCRFMDMGWTVSTARLLAASGVAAITYSNRQPLGDALALLAPLKSHATTLEIDASRLGVWATSGHGPVALALAAHAHCAVLLNPYLCDLDEATHVASAAAAFKFAVPPPVDLPRVLQFVVRSGKDEMPGLNASLDGYVASALQLDRPVTLVNIPGAPHAFDLLHDAPITRTTIRLALDFVKGALSIDH